MKIAYLDFNEDDFHEDYSVSPNAYGGGRVFASIAKEALPDFHIFSNPNSFKNLGPNEKKSNCHPLDSVQRKAIRDNQPIKDIIPNAGDFDLFVHHQVRYHVNTEGLKAKECCWAVGVHESVHGQNTNLLLYNDYQHPYIPPTTKVHKIVIGKPVPEFKQYQKENFIFQCTRHTHQFGSIHVANICKKFKIPVYFAGPIDKDYNLLSFIDNETTFYLGVIPESEKLGYLRRAKCCTFLHEWATPFNLSAVEALAHGTFVISTPVGFWPSLINGKNGSMVTTADQFIKAYNGTYNQKDCWDSVQPYTEAKMLESFYGVFTQIHESN